MRIRVLIGAVVAAVLLYGAWVYLVPTNRVCADGDNVCLFHKMLDVSYASMENSESNRDVAVQEMFDLCMRMFESHKKDECLSYVVSATDGELALEACAQFIDVDYKPEYSSQCELREIQAALRSASQDELDEVSYQQFFDRCSQLENIYASKDRCLFELAIHYADERARRACDAIRSASEFYEGYKFSREACFEQVGQFRGD